MVKNLPANAGDMGLTAGLGQSHIPQGNEAPTESVPPMAHAL